MALSMSLRLSAFVLCAIASPTGHAGRWSPGWPGPDGPRTWNLKNFTSLVTFGDSYTDDSRLSYFINHDGQAPPIGWVNPPNYAAADGGRPWPQYVRQYTGVNLYNYAVAGAVCSNAITPRNLSALGYTYLFPAVQQYEIPAYIADSKYVEPDGSKFMIDPAQETVYSIWIGTNDLGVDALLSDAQVAGTNIVSYVDCVYDQLKRVYDNGGRYFVLQNVAPLNLAPLYGLPGRGGVTSNAAYWPDKPSNLTEISYRMMEQVVTVNAIYDYRTPFVALMTRAFPEARFAVMDMHALITDMYNDPSAYLNGTAPLNVTGAVHKCDVTGEICVSNSSPDSFLWYDDLHPSEQAERVFARTFVDVVKGKSQYVTYW